MLKNKTVNLVIITALILSTLSIVTMNNAESSIGMTLYVGGSEPGNYTRIQDAIDNASDGDTVFVYNGTYYENILIDTPLILMGEHKYGTIIDASGYGDVIAVLTSNCTITGFTLSNSGNSDGGHINCGIYCDHYSPRITNDIVTENNNGIGCWNDASPMIQNNIITNNTNDGIYVYACSPYIKNNSFIGNGYSGITLRATSTATIIGNIITCNPQGINCNYVTGNSTQISDNYISYNNRGIKSDGSYNITLRSNTIHNNSEYGIAFSYSSLHNIIDGNIFFNNSDISIGLSKSCTNNTITNNILRQSHTGINLSSSQYNFLMNNTIKDNQFGIQLTDSSNNTIFDNNFSHNDAGLNVRYSRYNVIINNTFMSNVWNGFSFTDSSENIFSNNLFFNDGVSLSYSTSTIIAKNYNNTVSNNTVNRKPLIYIVGESDSTIVSEAWQLVLIGCDNITLQDQTVSNTPVGLQLIDTTNCLIKGQNIKNNRYGIRALYSYNNTFLDNNISHNIVGIYVYRGTDNIILDNNISHTNGRGIFLHFSNNNTINNNTVYDNKEGITLYSSSDNNILYHNRMINNTLQAYDECSNTKWDNGYPSGGNYWSDFDEPSEGAYDNYNGPNQDLPGSDGIADTSSMNPYSIPGGVNQDRYPLIPQWNTTLIPPTCSLYGNPISGNAPLIVTFSMDANDPDGTIDTWSLDINNDGTIDYSGMGSPPNMQQHTYTNPGSYTARLLVTDNQSATASDTSTITVNEAPPENQPPEASFSFSPVILVVDETISFDGSSSIDPDGSLVSYEWDFNNDGIYEKAGITPTYIWSSAGEYHVSLRVTDNDGSIDIHTKTLTVVLTINMQPTCSLIVNPTNGTSPLMVTFTLSASDSDGSINRWKLDINNDGTADYSESDMPPSTLQYTYQTAGDYIARFTVTDNEGATNSDMKTITVNQAPLENQPPVASFSYSIDGYNVTFTDGSEDPDEGIIAWYWDFGDDNFSTVTNPNHTYKKKGSYTVTVTVTDTNGDTDTYSKRITVTAEDDGDGIPGFEFIAFMLSIVGLLSLARRKRKHGYR